MKIEYDECEKQMNEILDRYRNIFRDCQGRKYYGLIGKRIPAGPAFRLIEDIVDEFENLYPEIFYLITSNSYQNNFMFIDVLIEDPGKLCSFWGYGVDYRSGKYKPGFNLHIGLCHMKKQDYKFLNYKQAEVPELKSELAGLIESNLSIEDKVKRGIYDIGIKA
jgi:hypothetical protein